MYTHGTNGKEQNQNTVSKLLTMSKLKLLITGAILVKDAIADITLQQVLTRPSEFDVIATMNLNGDYFF
ncbi:MAG: hypothetical protein CM1200mP17_17920 [Woeseia sp.]|nr:MAG: hypothetical protein CM1200mP17_17920 [Woeseia sp.]